MGGEDRGGQDTRPRRRRAVTRSLWQEPLAPEARASALPPEADVVIIGGGAIGCATAWALHRADPSLRLVILEAERLAFGASGRNAGFVLLGAPGADPGAPEAAERERAGRLWRFTRENADLIRAMDGTAFDLAWPGSVIAAGDEAEAGMLKRQADALDSVDWLAPSALHARLSASGARGFYGGLFVQTGGTMDPAKYVRHLARASGAAVHERTPVTGLHARGGGVELQTARGEIRAARVVVCANAYLPQLLSGFASLVRPVRAQMLATAPLAPILDVPVYSHDGYFYLRQRPDGRLLLGGARHMHREAEVGYEDTATASLQASLEVVSRGALSRHRRAQRGAALERHDGLLARQPPVRRRRARDSGRGRRQRLYGPRHGLLGPLRLPAREARAGHARPHR